MKELGAAYLAHPGGVSVLATKSVKRVLEVHWLDLGIPEAMWVVEVENFGPTMVAIDSHGRNLFMEVMKRAESRRKEIFEELK
jgi:tartrate dehydratase beta subunit/fumarate hydratase class I family protein